jgi:hypothetical protein
MQPASVPISELLGSTPEETQQLKDQAKVVFPAFKGTGAWSVQRFEYVPMDESEFGYTVGDKVFQQKCAECYMFAEHKQVMVSVGINGEEFNPDPNYKRFLCTPCRDKANRPKKQKPSRLGKYVRYAGYSRKKPSYTAEEFEELQNKLNEQRIRNADSQSESTGTSSSDGTPEDERTNQAVSS